MWSKEFWKKGNGEMIAFVLILPFLILPIANTVYMLIDLTHYDVLRQTARQAILRMEIEGGMTGNGEYNLDAFLQSNGIDPEEVVVEATEYPVPYGGEVEITITKNYISRRYDITLGGIRRVDKNAQMVYGPITSISKKYFPTGP